MSSRLVDLPLAMRMFGWRVAIRPLKGLLPLPRLVRLMRRAPGSPHRRAAREARVVSLSHRLCRGRLREGSCLERSLLTYRFLAEAGAEPRLVIAVRRGGKSLEWHAWVTRDGQAVHESDESLSGYLPVVIFDTRGAVEWSSSMAGSLTGARL
jgi:Transglutaminase-like superfamily